MLTNVVTIGFLANNYLVCMKIVISDITTLGTQTFATIRLSSSSVRKGQTVNICQHNVPPPKKNVSHMVQSLNSEYVRH